MWWDLAYQAQCLICGLLCWSGPAVCSENKTIISMLLAWPACQEVSSTTKKRKFLTLQDKVDVIAEVKHSKQVDISKEHFPLTWTCFSTWDATERTDTSATWQASCKDSAWPGDLPEDPDHASAVGIVPASLTDAWHAFCWRQCGFGWLQYSRLRSCRWRNHCPQQNRQCGHHQQHMQNQRYWYLRCKTWLEDKLVGCDRWLRHDSDHS